MHAIDLNALGLGGRTIGATATSTQPTGTAVPTSNVYADLIESMRSDTSISIDPQVRNAYADDAARLLRLTQPEIPEPTISLQDFFGNILQSMQALLQLRELSFTEEQAFHAFSASQMVETMSANVGRLQRDTALQVTVLEKYDRLLGGAPASFVDTTQLDAALLEEQVDGAGSYWGVQGMSTSQAEEAFGAQVEALETLIQDNINALSDAQATAVNTTLASVIGFTENYIPSIYLKDPAAADATNVSLDNGTSFISIKKEVQQLKALQEELVYRLNAISESESTASNAIQLSLMPNYLAHMDTLDGLIEEGGKGNIDALADLQLFIEQRLTEWEDAGSFINASMVDTHSSAQIENNAPFFPAYVSGQNYSVGDIVRHGSSYFEYIAGGGVSFQDAEVASSEVPQLIDDDGPWLEVSLNEVSRGSSLIDAFQSIQGEIAALGTVTGEDIVGFAYRLQQAIDLKAPSLLDMTLNAVQSIRLKVPQIEKETTDAVKGLSIYGSDLDTTLSLSGGALQSVPLSSSLYTQLLNHSNTSYNEGHTFSFAGSQVLMNEDGQLVLGSTMQTSNARFASTGDILRLALVEEDGVYVPRFQGDGSTIAGFGGYVSPDNAMQSGFDTNKMLIHPQILAQGATVPTPNSYWGQSDFLDMGLLTYDRTNFNAGIDTTMQDMLSIIEVGQSLMSHASTTLVDSDGNVVDDPLAGINTKTDFQTSQLQSVRKLSTLAESGIRQAFEVFYKEHVHEFARWITFTRNGTKFWKPMFMNYYNDSMTDAAVKGFKALLKNELGWDDDAITSVTSYLTNDFLNSMESGDATTVADFAQGGIHARRAFEKFYYRVADLQKNNEVSNIDLSNVSAPVQQMLQEVYSPTTSYRNSVAGSSTPGPFKAPDEKSDPFWELFTSTGTNIWTTGIGSTGLHIDSMGKIFETIRPFEGGYGQEVLFDMIGKDLASVFDAKIINPEPHPLAVADVVQNPSSENIVNLYITDDKEWTDALSTEKIELESQQLLEDVVDVLEKGLAQYQLLADSIPGEMSYYLSDHRLGADRHFQLSDALVALQSYLEDASVKENLALHTLTEEESKTRIAIYHKVHALARSIVDNNVELGLSTGTNSSVVIDAQERKTLSQAVRSLLAPIQLRTPVNTGVDKTQSDAYLYWMRHEQVTFYQEALQGKSGSVNVTPHNLAYPISVNNAPETIHTQSKIRVGELSDLLASLTPHFNAAINTAHLAQREKGVIVKLYESMDSLRQEITNLTVTSSTSAACQDQLTEETRQMVDTSAGSTYQKAKTKHDQVLREVVNYIYQIDAELTYFNDVVREPVVSGGPALEEEAFTESDLRTDGSGEDSFAYNPWIGTNSGVSGQFVSPTEAGGTIIGDGGSVSPFFYVQRAPNAETSKVITGDWGYTAPSNLSTNIVFNRIMQEESTTLNYQFIDPTPIHVRIKNPLLASAAQHAIGAMQRIDNFFDAVQLSNIGATFLSYDRRASSRSDITMDWGTSVEGYLNVGKPHEGESYDLNALAPLLDYVRADQVYNPLSDGTRSAHAMSRMQSGNHGAKHANRRMQKMMKSIFDGLSTYFGDMGNTLEKSDAPNAVYALSSAVREELNAMRQTVFSFVASPLEKMIEDVLKEGATEEQKERAKALSKVIANMMSILVSLLSSRSDLAPAIEAAGKGDFSGLRTTRIKSSLAQSLMRQALGIVNTILRDQASAPSDTNGFDNSFRMMHQFYSANKKLLEKERIQQSNV